MTQVDDLYHSSAHSKLKLMCHKIEIVGLELSICPVPRRGKGLRWNLTIFLILPYDIHKELVGKNIRRLNDEQECEDCYEPGQIAKGICAVFYMGIYAMDNDIVVSIMINSL